MTSNEPTQAKDCSSSSQASGVTNTEPQKVKSVIRQIWDECLSEEGDGALPPELLEKLQELLKAGNAPSKEALESALFPTVTDK